MKTVKNSKIPHGSVAADTKTSSKFASSNSCSGKYVHKEKGQCYYTWEQAKNACTNGTHLPTKAELNAVLKSGEYKKWPKAGYYDPDGAPVVASGVRGRYWSATEYDSDSAWGLSFDEDGRGFVYSAKTYGRSVRCFK